MRPNIYSLCLSSFFLSEEWPLTGARLAHVGVGDGPGVGSGVGSGVGLGFTVGDGLGFAVGDGLGFAVGAGVGVTAGVPFKLFT